MFRKKKRKKRKKKRKNKKLIKKIKKNRLTNYDIQISNMLSPESMNQLSIQLGQLS